MESIQSICENYLGTWNSYYKIVFQRDGMDTNNEFNGYISTLGRLCQDERYEDIPDFLDNFDTDNLDFFERRRYKKSNVMYFESDIEKMKNCI